MGRTRINLVLLSALLAPTSLARAADRQPEGAPTPSATETVVRVFGRVCMAGANGPAREQWLRTARFQPAGPEQAARLTRNQPPGSVWLSPYAGRPMAVVLRQSGVMCQVVSPETEPQLAVSVFRSLLEEAERQAGLIAEKVLETSDVPGAAGQGRRLIYRIRPGPAAKGPSIGSAGLMLAMSVRPPAEGTIALILTASPAPSAP